MSYFSNEAYREVYPEVKQPKVIPVESPVEGFKADDEPVIEESTPEVPEKEPEAEITVEPVADMEEHNDNGSGDGIN